MTNPKDMTAAELANALSLPAEMLSTGWLSMLDEATIAFGSLDPHIREAQGAFSQARSAHMRSWGAPDALPGDLSPQAWDRAVAAARELANALRPLGDLRIARCKRQTGWGTCNLPLDPDGSCTYEKHTD